MVSCSLVNGGLCFIYFGTTLSISSLAADPYISLAIIGFCEAVRYLFYKFSFLY